MPALRSKTRRLLPGNVRNKRLTRIQRRILRRLKSKRRYIGKTPYLRQNLNSYLKPQAIRKLSPFYGNLPIAKMHGGTERASYIPLLLNLETRLDVILVRLHFCETLPQARQLISHRKIRVNNEMVNMTRFQVSRGDLISIGDNSVITTVGKKVRKSFYKKGFVDQIVGKFRRNHPRRRIRTKKGWFRPLEKRQGCRLLLKSFFSQRLRSPQWRRRFMQKKTSEGITSVLKGLCLGSLLAEHDKIKRFYMSYSDVLFKRRNGEAIEFIGNNRPTYWDFFLMWYFIVRKKKMLRRYSAYWFARERRRIRRKIRIRRRELPTHYLEVNYRTLKAVVFYGPDIGHIPPDMKLKNLNLP